MADELEAVRVSDLPLLPESTTFFDVHMESLSQEMREMLLRHMVNHGLCKQDAGILFSTVLLAVENMVAQIPERAREAHESAAAHAAESVGSAAEEAVGRSLNAFARSISETLSETKEAFADSARAEARNAALEVAAGQRAAFSAALGEHAKGVAKESSSAVKQGVAVSVKGVMDEMGLLEDRIRKARSDAEAISVARFVAPLVAAFVAGVATTALAAARLGFF